MDPMDYIYSTYKILSTVHGLRKVFELLSVIRLISGWHTISQSQDGPHTTFVYTGPVVYGAHPVTIYNVWES